MASTAKIRSKLAKLDKSLDELESQLEPLFSQSFPETLLALDTIQQAKLQVIVPYVVYDLVFVYLKSRGIDPKSHRVISELERVRQYFDKIKHAEETDLKRKLTVDKEAANRFIKHAIAQAKNAQLVDEPSDVVTTANSSTSREHVPVKVTGKMVARAEYEKLLRDLGSEEEDDLEMFDEELAAEGKTIAAADVLLEESKSTRPDKGKGRASEEGEGHGEKFSSSREKRSRIDPFSDCDVRSSSESILHMSGHSKKANFSEPADKFSPVTVSTSATDGEVEKAAKKGKRKAKKQRRS